MMKCSRQLPEALTFLGSFYSVKEKLVKIIYIFNSTGNYHADQVLILNKKERFRMCSME